ncbi:SRPBCC family protein [Williamsia sp. CHRR-6]|uniref:SRPBCC family protein n=1 Tax=Williamsia sp. CHRR-6 TaxID=2835871 RepID=UPI001BD924D5|nr:SRPBCC family protein [Williamsia sp. CHRR-6]MBT0567432.1 SRPBCC family protein [Williamsia sp. CHRR-6]
MRLRDRPTVEETVLVPADPQAVWQLVTDIELPTRFDGELQRVQWVPGFDRVALGARFRGTNTSEQMGTWTTECEVVDLEPGRRWVWAVRSEPEPLAHWGFEVEPSSRGTVVRQFAKMGTGFSGITMAIDDAPEREGRIVAYRLGVWRQGILANLAGIAAEFEPGASAR